jgi:hypothetical protein
MLLPSEVPVLPASRHENLHEVPAPVEKAARAAAAVGHRSLRGDRSLDRFGGERLAQLGFTERAHALLIGQRHDLVPGRHAVEDALRVCDVLVLRDVEPAPQIEDRARHDRGAGAVGARAAPERILQPAEVLLPLLGPLDRLRDEVVDRGPPRPRRELVSDLPRREDAAGSAAGDLEDAGPQFAEHTAERPALRVRGGARGVAAVQRGGAEAERAGMHRLAKEPLHLGQLFGGRLGPLAGGLAHYIAADPE